MQFKQILVVSAAGAIVAGLYGIVHDQITYSISGDYTSWQQLCQHLDIRDIPAFVAVALIHQSSYLGGVAGLFLSIILLLREKRKFRLLEKESQA